MSNKNSTSLRRIRADLRELTMDKNSNDRYTAAPLEHDMFEWHFTIRGPVTTDYENGIYHGRILLPPDYPYKPPHIVFLTPNGRFETNTKICLSFSAYHPELWQPAWGIRLILEALIAFLPTPTDGAIGAIDYSSPERKKLAVQSQQYFCPTCQCFPRTLLRSPTQTRDDDKDAISAEGANSKEASSAMLRFQKEIEELQRLQFMEHSKKDVTVKETEVKNDAAIANADIAEMDAAKKMTEREDDPQLQRDQTSGVATIQQSQEEVTSQGPSNQAVKVTETPLQAASTTDDTIIPAPRSTDTRATSAIMSEKNRNAKAATTSMMDHLLNGVMILFAIICAILLHNIQVLLLEIRDLSSGSSN